MGSIKVNYKLVKKIQDDHLDVDQLNLYELSLLLGVRDFQVAVVSSNNEKRILLLEDYVIGELNSTQEWLELIKDIFDAHPIINAGYWKSVKIVIKNKKFVQVPVSLFDEKESRSYLRFNAQIADHERVLYYEDSKAGVVTIFSVPDIIYDWFQSTYSNVRCTFYHHSCTIISGSLSLPKSIEESLYIFVDRFRLHIVSIKGKKLIFYNQFVIREFSEYVKYIMLVLKGLSMKQETCKIFLWGFIGKKTPHYQELCRYIRNIEFGERLNHLHFGYLFDEIQEQSYFDVYASFLLK